MVHTLGPIWPTKVHGKVYKSTTVSFYYHTPKRCTTISTETKSHKKITIDLQSLRISSYLQYVVNVLIINPSTNSFQISETESPSKISDFFNPSTADGPTRPDNTRVRLNSGYPPRDFGWRRAFLGPKMMGRMEKVAPAWNLAIFGVEFLRCRCLVFFPKHQTYDIFTYICRLFCGKCREIYHPLNVWVCSSFPTKKTWGFLFGVCFVWSFFFAWMWIPYLVSPPIAFWASLKIYPQVPVETNWNLLIMNLLSQRAMK